jgi:hypothetical protein
MPEGLDAGESSDALAWLAGEYLRAYGPARVADFAWWAGVTKRAAANAIATHRTIDVGDDLVLPARDAKAFERVGKLRGTVELLPKWDSYTMGHAPDGRRRFVHPDVQRRVYTPIGTGFPGDGNPVVLVDGEADEDELLLVAADAGADDVEREGGSWRVVAAPEALSAVRDAIEAAGFTVESADLTMVPKTTVALEDESAAKKVLRLMDALEENDDVQDVYANFDIPERVLEAVAS